MSNFFKRIFIVSAVLWVSCASAQTTTSSTYSQLGLGLLSEPVLPQTRAMGGISTGINRVGAFNNINIANPASYSSIRLTTFDAGLAGELINRSKNGNSENGFTGSLSHLVFAVPVTRQSALSFGLVPYSSLGYKSRTTGKVDTLERNTILSGDGGLSKAYLGYGIQIGKHFNVGANASYTFGKLEREYSVEVQNSYNTRMSNNSSVKGFGADYGVQYHGNLAKDVRLTLGYAGSANTKLDMDVTRTLTRYLSFEGNEGAPLDTILNQELGKSNLKLPLKHGFGFSIEKYNKWLIGADIKLAQWSDFRINDAADKDLQNAMSIAVGGQITPDINSVGSYLKLIDYRVGFKYDKTNMKVNGTDVDQKSITLGFGFPLQSSPTRTTFYKLNFAAELGQRGTEKNNLVKENFINLHLGFTINDQWFRKYKFD